MAHNCPQNNRIRSTNRKPSGMSTFNIEFDEDLEILESLLLRMVDVESQDADYNWCADYLDWNQLGART